MTPLAPEFAPDAWQAINVVNLHRLDRANPGDLWAAPLNYLPTTGRRFDIAAPPQAVSCDLLIVGGGGIVTDRGRWKGWLEGWMDAIACRKAVIWGANVAPGMVGLPIMDRFDLIGARNVNAPFRFVPCASCLHSAFDDAPRGRGVGVISHRNRIIPGSDIVNSPNDFETIVDFISARDTIVTSSYHAAYWSMLMDRRVYLYDSPDFTKRFPPKLSSMELQPPRITDLSQVEDIASPSGSGAPGALLERYRGYNRAFARDVLDLRAG